MITYGLIYYSNKGLQHLCHIEFDVRDSVNKQTISFCVTIPKTETLQNSFNFKSVNYLSFDAVTRTGSSLEHVISEPMTGASRDIARKIVIRYK